MANYKYTGTADFLIFTESDFTSRGVDDQDNVTFFGLNDVRELSEDAFALLVASGYPLVLTTDPVGPGGPIINPADYATVGDLLEQEESFPIGYLRSTW